ncbi:hypothetical protein X798_01575 [Onchocerca flexuosa]|uniref:Outer membrane lipoprotein BamD-like domain-containing protein n=1 Tax=Onchocerca flexuosa TaxID=387005 RepID=A0A238C293_9BILA|nr:hypothetical protein X798_01575 [Onchocerca flexuosa]
MVQSYANDYERIEAELYKETAKLFDEKKYKRAFRAFQKIENLHPFSYAAMKARLFCGVSHYKMGEYASAENQQ